ncbi:MAG TPA: Gfo/Idh/MocA family oxidoreductase [Dehalococcoidia bacterium]|nr:Gfo/Idh/MocA family oxidoreductase [Dehalococcoidia bacterium]
MKRYALVGCGVRGISMYARPIIKHYGDVAELAALCDTNRTRMEACNRYCESSVGAFTDYEAMLKEVRPDAVIVTSPDWTHHEMIIRALESGCEVITEKPMTIDDEKCRAILDAEKRTGRRVTVAFNYRYSPQHQQIKRLIMDGAIGDVMSVDFHWPLDYIHGADFFRRWHRRLENSGGLLVHKATHHFDLINWWIASEPEEVFAHGRRAFYGPTREQRGERCHGCAHASTCEFYFDMSAVEYMRTLYLDAESEDGYFRDRCVFADEIDIYDTMSVTARYRSGAMLTYSLTAYAPWEGYTLVFNGTQGGLEVLFIERSPGRDPGVEITLHPLRRPAERIEPDTGPGEHYGGDRILRDHLFRGLESDPLGLQADSRAGAMSILTGVAANRSISSGRPVQIADLMA